MYKQYSQFNCEQLKRRLYFVELNALNIEQKLYYRILSSIWQNWISKSSIFTTLSWAL